jgi:uncharacterized glyoxalase superfamily protein PhnB
MDERELIEKLESALDATLAGERRSGPIGDIRIAELAWIAEALRTLPDPEFRNRLRQNLLREKTEMTTATYIREGYHTLTPYLVVQGAPRLIDFLKDAFDGVEQFRMARPDGSLMHAEVRVGDSMVELADANEQSPPTPTALHLYVPDSDDVFHQALSVGATPIYEPMDMPYGDREGGVTDPVGNHWYIATHKGGSHVMPGLRSVTPYLHPFGADRVLEFLKNAFGATEDQLERAPNGTIRHARIQLGDSILEMGEAHGNIAVPMPATFHYYVEDVDKVYERALVAGGVSLRPPQVEAYGERMAGVRDPAGNCWYIATHLGRQERG